VYLKKEERIAALVVCTIAECTKLERETDTETDNEVDIPVINGKGM